MAWPIVICSLHLEDQYHSLLVDNVSHGALAVAPYPVGQALASWDKLSVELLYRSHIEIRRLLLILLPRLVLWCQRLL